MDDEKLQLVKSLLEPVKSHVARFYLGGSGSLNYISSPNDYDIIVICETEDDRAFCKDFFRKSGVLREAHNEYKLSFLFKTVEKGMNGLYETFYPYFVRERVYHTFDSDEAVTSRVAIKTFLAKKDDVKSHLILALDNERSLIEKHDAEHFDEIFYSKKWWYHIYITVSIFKNGTYKLTSDQLKVANGLHDGTLPFSERKPIIDELMDDVNNL